MAEEGGGGGQSRADKGLTPPRLNQPRRRWRLRREPANYSGINSYLALHYRAVLARDTRENTRPFNVDDQEQDAIADPDASVN